MSGFSPRGGMKSIKRTAPLVGSISVSKMSVSSRYLRVVFSIFSFGQKRHRPFFPSPSNEVKHVGESNHGKQLQSTQPSRLTRAHNPCLAFLASRINLRDKGRGDRAMLKNCERKPQTQPAFRFRMQAKPRRRVFCQTKRRQAVLRSR